MLRLDRLSYVLGLLCLTTTLLTAQTKVRRYDVTRETDFGIVYRLPLTEVEALFTVRERVYTPGPLAAYARKYLSLSASSTPSRRFELLSGELHTLGRADSTEQYLVAFDKKTLAPFVKLTDDGVLYAINGSQDQLAEQLPTAHPLRRVISETQADRQLPALPREYTQAGTFAKQAEIAAAYLYDLRESLMSLVTGAAENMPKDGESMRLALEKLRSEERRTLRLFLGDTTECTTQHAVRYLPTGKALQEHVLARFSPLVGFVDEEDLTGDPIYLDLQIIEQAPALDVKEQKKKEKLLENSIVYRQPGTATLSLGYAGKVLTQERLSLSQLGSLQALAPKMLHIGTSATTAIYFDLRTGAIRDIRQE